MISPLQVLEQVLVPIKGIWQEQAIDEPTTAAWHEILGTLELPDVVEAIKGRARAGFDRPSAALVYAEASKVKERRLERERASQRAIGYEIPEEVRERNVQRFRKFGEELGFKWWIDKPDEPTE
jgi:hypothetical protein